MLWLAAIAVQFVTPRLTADRDGFHVSVAHFAERHGLVILIVLGESLVSIGVSGEHERVTLPVVGGIVAGLVALAAMWWVYFVGDDERAAQAMEAAPDGRRPMLAIAAYFVAHLIMIFGVVTLAAGARLSATHLTGAPASGSSAWLLGIGGGIYLAGAAAFRRSLRFASPWGRAGCAVVCLVTVPIGLHVSAAAQLVAIGAVMAVAAAGDPLRASSLR